MCCKIECNKRSQGMSDNYRTVQLQLVDELGQVVSMNGNAISTFRFIAIASSPQVIGTDTMVRCQVIGKCLKAESIGSHAMHANNGRTLLTPLDRMKRGIPCHDEFIAHWTRYHALLLAAQMRSSSYSQHCLY